MSDVLSQDEIDKLLKAFSSGEIDAEEFKETGEKQVKNYDFSRPSKFSKEHLRTLEIVFEHYCRLLSTHMPAYLRVTVQALGWRSGGRYLPLQDDLSSVAYWYSDTLDDIYPPLPSVNELEII